MPVIYLWNLRNPRLGALWESRALGGIDVVPDARLTRTLGRLWADPGASS